MQKLINFESNFIKIKILLKNVQFIKIWRIFVVIFRVKLTYFKYLNKFVHFFLMNLSNLRQKLTNFESNFNKKSSKLLK